MSKVMIGVSTAEVARRADFYDWLNNMKKPANSIVTYTHGQSPARNRNIIVEQALVNECTHVMFVDDDVILQYDTLEKLLSHEVDIVSGLYLMRNYPHKPIIMDSYDDQGRCSFHLLNDNENGLIKVAAAGLGSLLVKIEVFKKLERPWIRLGELEKDHWCDDLGFCKRAREAGFQPYCDLTATVGHIGSVVLWPQYENNEWFTAYSAGDPRSITVPQLKPHEVKV